VSSQTPTSELNSQPTPRLKRRASVALDYLAEVTEQYAGKEKVIR
jgi:hypothetical protein